MAPLLLALMTLCPLIGARQATTVVVPVPRISDTPPEEQRTTVQRRAMHRGCDYVPPEAAVEAANLAIEDLERFRAPFILWRAETLVRQGLGLADRSDVKAFEPYLRRIEDQIRNMVRYREEDRRRARDEGRQ